MSWRICLKDTCESRVRADNTTGYCPKHRHLHPSVRAQMDASERRRQPHRKNLSAADRARKVMGLAWAQAAGAGHNMSVMMRDEGEHGLSTTAYVSYCLECDRYLCVDLEESAAAYGDVVDQPCGPRQPAADRRSEWERHSAQAVASLERKQPIEDFARIYLNDGPCTREALDRAGW